MDILRTTQLIEHWNAQQEQTRACKLCKHGAQSEGKECTFLGDSKPRETKKARSPHGFCGPEALHLLIPSHEALTKPSTAFTWDDSIR